MPMTVMDALRMAVSDPQVRKFAAKTITSAADPCSAPDCSGKSPVRCMACDCPMCLTHAVFRVKPAGPICVACLVEVWGLADEDAPDETPRSKRARR